MELHEQPGDVLVVGAPRSGTSLVAQLLAGAGLTVGADLIPPTAANPLGFMEQVGVSDLNDELLEPHVVGQGAGQVPERCLAWLAALDPRVAIDASDGQQARMAAVVPASPAVVKDPRFTATLDAWRPALRPGTSFVGVVRHRAEVVTSLRTMWERDRPYYGDHEVTTERALALWWSANGRLCELLHEGRWFVVDHASLLDGSGVAPLGRFVGRDLDPDGVRGALHRSHACVPVPSDLTDLHGELVARAAADRGAWSRA